MGSSKNRRTSKRSSDNTPEIRNKKSWQEEQLVEQSEVKINDTSGNRNAHRKQCEHYIDSNNNDHEPEDDVEKTSGKTNDQDEQQKSTQNNKNKK